MYCLQTRLPGTPESQSAAGQMRLVETKRFSWQLTSPRVFIGNSSVRFQTFRPLSQTNFSQMHCLIPQSYLVWKRRGRGGPACTHRALWPSRGQASCTVSSRSLWATALRRPPASPD